MQMRQMYDKDIEREMELQMELQMEMQMEMAMEMQMDMEMQMGKIEELWTRGIYTAAGQCCLWNLLSQISCSGR